MAKYIDAEAAKRDGWRATRTIYSECSNTIDIRDIDTFPIVDISPQKDEWIDVKKQLPCIGDEVIVTICDDSGDTPWLYTTVGWYAMEGNRWVVDNEFNTRVTHWMPMPKPFSPSKNDVLNDNVNDAPTLEYPFNVYLASSNGHTFWAAECPDLKGCVGQGETADEAISELRENAKIWMEEAATVGIPIPEVPVRDLDAENVLANVPERDLFNDLTTQAKMEVDNG